LGPVLEGRFLLYCSSMKAGPPSVEKKIRAAVIHPAKTLYRAKVFMVKDPWCSP
jgi:hypothetical protein